MIMKHAQLPMQSEGICIYFYSTVSVHDGDVMLDYRYWKRIHD